MKILYIGVGLSHPRTCLNIADRIFRSSRTSRSPRWSFARSVTCLHTRASPSQASANSCRFSRRPLQSGQSPDNARMWRSNVRLFTSPSPPGYILRRADQMRFQLTHSTPTAEPKVLLESSYRIMSRNTNYTDAMYTTSSPEAGTQH